MFNEETIRKNIYVYKEKHGIEWIIGVLKKCIGEKELGIVYPKNDRSKKDLDGVEILAYKNNSIFRAFYNDKESCIEVNKIDRSNINYLNLRQYSGEEMYGNLLLDIHLNDGNIITLDAEKDGNSMFKDDYKEFIFEIMKNL